MTAYLALSDRDTDSRDKVMEFLKKAHDEHSTALKADPSFDPMRSDSRLQEVLKDVELN